MEAKPTSVVILGKTYDIKYVNSFADVDEIFEEVNIHKPGMNYFGQIELLKRKIRIYNNDRSLDAIWESIIHEVLHAIMWEYHIENTLKEKEHKVLARALLDTFIRNGWMELPTKAEDKSSMTEGNSES